MSNTVAAKNRQIELMASFLEGALKGVIDCAAESLEKGWHNIYLPIGIGLRPKGVECATQDELYGFLQKAVGVMRIVHAQEANSSPLVPFGIPLVDSEDFSERPDLDPQEIATRIERSLAGLKELIGLDCQFDNPYSRLEFNVEVDNLADGCLNFSTFEELLTFLENFSILVAACSEQARLLA